MGLAAFWGITVTLRQQLSLVLTIEKRFKSEDLLVGPDQVREAAHLQISKQLFSSCETLGWAEKNYPLHSL